MELLGDDPPLSLDDPEWPFLTGSLIGGPTASAGRHRRSVTAGPGLLVAGTVRNSVLGRNVRVERGATVSDSVVLDDAVIRDGAVIDRAIVDGGVTVDAAPTPTIDEPSGIAVYGETDDGSAED